MPDVSVKCNLCGADDTDVIGTRARWGERMRNVDGKGAGFRIRFQALSQPLSGDAEADAQRINSDLERLIRNCPTQYLWGYNRYKRPAGAPPPPAGHGT